MKQMRAYILDLGSMQSDSNLAYWGSTLATRAQPNMPHHMNTTPSYAVLIDHPQAGWILYDTGMGDPNEWPRHILETVLAEQAPTMTMEYQLHLLGLKPADINYVIISHMHMDHIGNDRLFGDTAEFFVAKDELAFASQMVMSSKNLVDHGFFIREDVLWPRKRLHYLDRDEELFPGIEVILLPGHTPGLVGLVVHLDSGTLIFPSDAIADRKNYEGFPPANLHDSLRYRQSIRKVKDLQKKYRAQVFFSHDPVMIQQEMKKAPDYYA
ncbi:N-acyl homoserine lactonase family protein [Agathobaculum sp. TL06]